ncbi:MAG: amidohydrolase [Anaeroplasma sp.]|nr:amidohydrolase [Anaeroplasma sp.]
MEELVKLVLNETEKNYTKAVELRRYFHSHPELPKEEFNTAKRIEEELDKLNIEHKRVGETGVYAEIIGTKDDKANKTIVLRADIDALPIEETNNCEYKSLNEGVMHACGHDAHTASLLVSAKILSENKNLFSGKIKLCFQQAEEIGYGARLFIDGGYLEGASRSFGIHVGSNIPVGSIVIMEGANNASVDWFRISIEGKASHVSTPELGCDAAYIISQIVVAVQSLVTRTTSPMENVLIGIGKINAGTGYNIVAENATAEGTIRVFSPEIRKSIKERLENLVYSISQIYGAKAHIEWKDFTSPLINDSISTKEAQIVARKLFEKDKIITSRKPSLSGDDMAEFINKVPGVYAFVGTRNEAIENTTVAHHNSNFDIDENGLKTSIKITTLYALEYLTNSI